MSEPAFFYCAMRRTTTWVGGFGFKTGVITVAGGDALRATHVVLPGVRRSIAEAGGETWTPEETIVLSLSTLAARESA